MTVDNQMGELHMEYICVQYNLIVIRTMKRDHHAPSIEQFPITLHVLVLLYM